MDVSLISVGEGQSKRLGGRRSRGMDVPALLIVRFSHQPVYIHSIRHSLLHLLRTPLPPHAIRFDGPCVDGLTLPCLLHVVRLYVFVFSFTLSQHIKA